MSDVLLHLPRRRQCQCKDRWTGGRCLSFKILQQKRNRVIERLKMWSVDRTDLGFIDDDQGNRCPGDEEGADFRLLQKTW